MPTIHPPILPPARPLRPLNPHFWGTPDNFADGVDKVKDDLTDVHGSLHYNLKDQFPQFCKEALSFVPEAYWWAFSLAILFGFVMALYRRMT